MRDDKQILFSDEDLLPISALSEIVFCERRAALQQIEGIWEDNIFTIEGSHLHQKVHKEESYESRGDIRIARGLRLRSLRLGLTGITDVVEFHKVDSSIPLPPSESSTNLKPSVELEGVKGRWIPFIVEYKRGRLRHEKSFEVQLCAQALCLEEMMKVNVPAGAVFYGKPRRRLEVIFTPELRAETETAAARLHELISSGKTPPPQYEKKCESCSLMSLCMPKTLSAHKNVEHYIKRSIIIEKP